MKRLCVLSLAYWPPPRSLSLIKSPVLNRSEGL